MILRDLKFYLRRQWCRVRHGEMPETMSAMRKRIRKVLDETPTPNPNDPLIRKIDEAIDQLKRKAKSDNRPESNSFTKC